MKKIILILFLIVFIAACSGNKDAAQPKAGTPFLGGTTGAIISFVENSPPPEVFDGGESPFNVVVKIKNMGEYFIPKEKMFVELQGFAPDAFSLTPAQLRINPPEDLIADTIDTQGIKIEGNEVYVEFQNLNHAKPITGAAFTYPLRANVCYNYGTVAQSSLCARKSLTQPEEGGICNLNEQKVVFNSGAPVQITTLRETPLSSNKISFQFDIQHVGTIPGGKVFELNTECRETFRTYEDKVKVRVSTDLPGLECTGLVVSGTGNAGVEGMANLYGGKKTVHCNQVITNMGDYEFPVKIELLYDYRNQIEKQIIVKHAGGI